MAFAAMRCFCLRLISRLVLIFIGQEVEQRPSVAHVWSP